MMANLGCPQSDEQVQKLIEGVDTDGNGMIEFDEFIGIMASRMLKTDGEGELEQALSMFDNGTGFLPVEQMRKVLSEMGSSHLNDAELDELVKLMPTDAQGRVSMEAFRALDCWRVPSTHAYFRRKSVTSRTEEEAAGAGGSSSG